MRRLIITLAVVLLSVGAFAQELTILHLNDTHSHIDPERSGKHAGKGGVIEQALYIDEVRAEEGKKNVLLLHAGDFSQGSSYFTELNGDLEIAVLNACRYDAVCLGNHEFDNGIEELARRLGNLKVPVVCANYDFSATPLAEYVRPYVILKKAGLKIGIIGLLTDLSEVVNSDIAAQEKDCDLVICLTHLGFEDESYTDVMMAPLTRNVDIIVGGHSHTKLKEEARVKNLDGKDVVIVTDWKWGLKVGKLSVEL